MLDRRKVIAAILARCDLPGLRCIVTARYRFQLAMEWPPLGLDLRRLEMALN